MDKGGQRRLEEKNEDNRTKEDDKDQKRRTKTIGKSSMAKIGRKRTTEIKQEVRKERMVEITTEVAR